MNGYKINLTPNLYLSEKNGIKDKPLTEPQMEAFAEIMSDEVSVMDEKTALLEGMEINQKKLSFLANKLQQPITVEVNDLDDVKTMADGTEYKCSIDGWVKVKTA